MMAPRSSWFAIIRSNQRRRIAARSLPVRARHAGSAALANSIARRASPAPILGTCPITAPVEGLSTAILPPVSAGTHSPATRQASRNRVGSLRVSLEVIVNAARLELIRDGVDRAATGVKPLRLRRRRYRQETW